MGYFGSTRRCREVRLQYGANDRDDRNGEGQWTWDRGSGNPVLFYTVTMGGMRMAVNGAFHDWAPMQPGYAGMASSNVGDCGTFDADLDFRWDDRACAQAPINAFACGEIPSLAAARQRARASLPLRRIEPRESSRWGQDRNRYREIEAAALA